MTTTKMEASLVIIGAGYAGMNALYAAKRELPRKATVVMCDRAARVGGNWQDQYEFVRLHDSYTTFSVVGQRWKLKAKRGYLAARDEILDHFEDLSHRLEKRLDLQMRLQHEFEGYEETADGKRLLVRIRSADGAETIVETPRIIVATGFNLPILRPLEFSAGAPNIVSTSPADPYFADADFLEGDRDVYVLGGGKTSLDTVLHLAEHKYKGDIYVVHGAGTLFVNRASLAPATTYGRYFTGKTFTRSMLDTLHGWSGRSEEEVIARLLKSGAFISPFERPRSFQLGILSPEECAAFKAAATRLVAGHCEDVVTTDGAPVMVLRSGERLAMRPGSVVVNCTSHFQNRPLVPLVQANGKALYPQHTLAFTGASAFFLTLAFFRGKLTPRTCQRFYQFVLQPDRSQERVTFRSVLAGLTNNLIISELLLTTELMFNNTYIDALFPMVHRLRSAGSIAYNRNFLYRQARKLCTPMPLEGSVDPDKAAAAGVDEALSCGDSESDATPTRHGRR